MDESCEEDICYNPDGDVDNKDKRDIQITPKEVGEYRQGHR